MQFTTFVSFATSLALASAGIIQERQWDGAVAVVNVYDYNTTNCAEDEPTVEIGVGPLAVDLCVPFSQGYWTVSYSYLESIEYSIAFYTTDDCTYSPEAGDDFAMSNSPGPCDTASHGKPWLSYRVNSPANSPGHSKN